MKILLVEDDDDSAELLTCLFERQGWSVTVAAGIEEARRELLAGDYRLLLTDYYLFDGVGLSLLEPAPPPAPCIAILMTGALDDELRLKSKALGFRECFPKPLNGDALLARIRALTGGGGSGA